MKISTKYIIEFVSSDIVEMFALCDSMELVKEYLLTKFRIREDMIEINDEYCMVIKLENCGKIRVRKVDLITEV